MTRCLASFLTLTLLLCLAVWTTPSKGQSAFSRTQEASDLVASARNLHRIGKALEEYHDSYNAYPPYPFYLLSWRVALLPYLGHNELWKQFKLDQPWDSDHNKTLLAKMPDVYRHPGAKTDTPGMTFYRGLGSPYAMFGPFHKLERLKDRDRFLVRKANLLDGASEILHIVESAEPVPWTKPEELPYEIDQPLPKLGGQFADGFLALFCNGHVHFIAKGFDEKTMRQVIHKSDGVPSDFKKLTGGRGPSNLLNIGLAIHAYAQENQGLLPQPIMDENGKPLLSWRVTILRYLGPEEEAAYRACNRKEPWDSPHNKQWLLEKMPRVYAHPSANVKNRTETVYQAFSGRGTLFEPGLKLSLAQIPDGRENTVQVVEAADGVPWTKPDDLVYDPTKPLPRLGGHLQGGFSVLWCDGSTSFIRAKFDETTMRRAVTRNDGQRIDRSLIEGP